jgi:acyl-homoserine lactone acylase PvdQ
LYRETIDWDKDEYLVDGE